MLKNLFKKTFDIRDGEIRISFFMQLYIFLLITVLLMVKPTINALFLSKLGAAHLPYGYILVAIVAVITSYFYNLAVKRYSLKSIATSTLVFFSALFMLLGVFMIFQFTGGIVLYIYYLSVSLFAVLVTSQFWIIANMVFNAREAKRLFGFIGAGAIAGGIFGGYLTSIIAPVFGNKTVIFTASILILACIPILHNMWKLRVVPLNSYVKNQRALAKTSSYNSPYKLIINSKHLSYLAAIVGVGVIMAKLVDFQFSDFANRAIPDSDALASFFGFWFSTFNVIALCIQLFFTNKLLAWLGVTTNLMLLPLGIAIGCLLFLTFPELWVLVIIKGLDGSLKQSLNKASIELSIMPIPSQVKNQAKSYIDVVIDSIATGFSGLLLIFFIKKMELNTSYITVIILLILFVWIFLIYKLREAYFESFRTNIQTSLVSKNETTSSNPKLKFNFNTTLNILKNGEEAEILNVLNYLDDLKLKTFQPVILKLLDHKSTLVQTKAIEQLYRYDKGVATQKVQELIATKDDQVVYQAMDYLLHHTDMEDTSIFNSYLDHPSDYISNAALLCLAKDASSNNTLATTYKLNERIALKIKELFAVDNDLRKEEIAELLVTIGYAAAPKFYSFIAVQFNNKDPYVVNYAIKAAGITLDEQFIEPLLAFLAQKKHRKEARNALRNYGVSIIKTILKKDEAESLPDGIKSHIPRVIQSFKDRDSLKLLMRLLKSKDFIIRLEAAKSLNNIKEEQPKVSFDQRAITKVLLREITYFRNSIRVQAVIKNILQKDLKNINDSKEDTLTDLHIAYQSLQEILSKQLELSLKIIFKLLSLKYDSKDIDTAYYGLQSDSADTKINAIEFLDNLLKSRLKNAMLPSLEYHVIEPETYDLQSHELKPLTLKKALKLLLKKRGVNSKLAVLNILRYLKDPSFKSAIQLQLRHKNRRVRGFAQNALAALNE